MGYSVVNQSLYKKIQNGTVGNETYGTNLGYNLIRIVPNLEKWAWRSELTDSDRQDAMFKAMNKAMVGLMTNELQYNLNSSWETMEYPAILNMGLISDLAAFRGGGEFGAVFKSKKVWKKSGDLTLTPEIRIIDVNGDGLPLRTARQMIMWSTALGTRELLEKGEADAIRESAQGVLNSLAGKIRAGTQNMIEDLNPNADATGGENLGKTAYDASSMVNLFGVAGSTAAEGASNLIEDIDDYAKLKFSPPPLQVQIGRIFDHDDMVLTNVDFTFSRESTVAGPIYVDMKLTLVTRSIVSDVNDTGLYRAVDTPGRGNIVLTGGGAGNTEVVQEETHDTNFVEEGEVPTEEVPTWVNDLDSRTRTVNAAGIAGAGYVPSLYR